MLLLLGIRFLIAVAVIVFAVRLWFRLFRPQASAERKRTATRAVFVLIGILIAVEQSFLHFLLDREVQQRTKEHMAFVEQIKSRPGGLESIRRKYCESRRAALIYSYKLCVFRLLIGDDDPRKERFSVYGIKPAGWLTLVPWNDGDRSIFHGFQITYLDNFGAMIAPGEQKYR